MKAIGSLMRFKINHIDDLRFWDGHAGGAFKTAFGILIREPEIQDCMIKDEYGEYEFDHRCLFDIMVNPTTKSVFAVFIPNVFDRNSDVFMMEVID